MISWNVILFSVYQVIVILAIIHVVMDNRQPAKTMAWALVIWFVPVVGLLFYLFFGLNTRKEKFISQRSLDQLSKRSMLEFVEQKDLQLPAEHRQLIDLFVNENFSLPFKDNQVTVYDDGYAFFPALLAEIAKAERHIHIDMYIFAEDPLGMLLSDALIDKAHQGVEVKLIYDDVGCWNVSHAFFDRMRDEGMEVVPFLPVRFPSFTSKVNYRNHRKLIVIDGRIGFIGGMNVALRYVKGTGTQPWRDTMLKVEGTGVYGLQRAFLIDWYFCDRTLISDRKYYPTSHGDRNDVMSEISHAFLSPCEALTQVVTSGPVAPYPEIMQGYVRIILSAKRYVYLETPYFLPTEPVLFALKTASIAGVDVRIIVPYRSDAKWVEWASRSYLREVVEAGVTVKLYQAGFLHSKLLVCDDTICSCGSTNVDIRSFENNFESNIFLYGEAAAQQLRELFEADEKQSVNLQDIPQRMHPKFMKRLWESMVRLMSPLM
ncbi:MAG: cardiolipin synthase [Prevotella sp.]|nr:cardiolipin synthase [Prevotella sp.]